jgi:DNA-binding transcriptional LysR family regulator
MDSILDERVLRLFLTLSEELHFGRAASRLHISQPTLSDAIKKIERRLDVQLFRRSSRNVELTRAGELLAIEAKRLIDETQAAITRVQESARRFEGPLRIGYSSTLNMRWVSAMIAAVQKNAVLAVDTEFVNTTPREIETRLTKGELHAGLLLGPASKGEWDSICLAPDEFCLAVSHTHRFAQSRRITAGMLASESMVWLQREPNSALHDKVLEGCMAIGFQPRFTHEVSSFYECLQFARADLAVALTPNYMQDDPFESVVFRQLPRKLFTFRNLITRHDSGIEPLKRFLQFAREFARDHHQ